MIKNSYLSYIIFIQILLFSGNASAYAISRTQHGVGLWWAKGTVQNYIETANSSGLSHDDILAIYQEAISEWAPSTLGFDISTQVGTTSTGNNIYFDGDSGYFNGSGVIAVTQTAYRESTGQIVNAEIIINDQKLFSGNSADKMYLGNVLSHELGHLLGLSHSEVKDSTMFYLLTRNQWSTEKDDLAGFRSIYSVDTSYGTILGRIVGGENLLGIFGAHVSAISADDGAVVSAISDSDGSFVIKGIEKNSSYYISVTPLKSLTPLPSYYATAETNFCLLAEDYKTSFFQPCEDRLKGYPTPVVLDLGVTSFNVGTISIQCSLDSPTEYLSGDSVELSTSTSETRGSFIGYSVNEGNEDFIEIDLSGYVPSSENEYLSLNVVGQGLFSPIILDVEVYQNDIKIAEYLGEDGDRDLDITGKIYIGEGTPGIYSVKVITNEIVELGDIYNSGFTSTDYFPEGDSYIDQSSFYLFTYEIVTFSNGKYVPVGAAPSITDNLTCPKATNAYSVSSNIPVAEEEEYDDGNAGISCASLDTGDGPGGGLSIIVGFMLGIVMLRLAGRDQLLKNPLE